MKKLLKFCLGLLIFAGCLPAAAREFRHPGLSYTDDDFARMRKMISEEKEPYLTTFNALKSYVKLSDPIPDRGTAIAEGRFNATVGVDGRRAHDLALLWKVTGDETYARKAVEFINANSYYTNTSSRGTGPLDNGKIYLLVEAAEMMRDYEGWSADDQQRFKDMLVYPGYSSEVNMYDLHHSTTDEENGITFYWNIFNFDSGRFGNQGLFAARALMAIGIYLDNEKIYDRALRYLRAQPHRADDLAYAAGPPKLADTPYDLDETDPEAGDNTTTFMYGYKWSGTENSVEDYGYDEQLRHYIYASGQSQEACRDQDHAMVGVGLLGDIAEMAWNQGDDFYGDLDNRILKGMEWAFRYNLSYIMDSDNAWEPAGFTSDEDEATFSNGLFLRKRCRSGRWESILPSTKGRGDSFMAGGNREQTLAHYMLRAGSAARSAAAPEDYEWLKAYRDYMMEKYGYESYGKDSNHRYEWKGWGSLTKRLDPVEDNLDTEVSEIADDCINRVSRHYVGFDGVPVRTPVRGMLIVEVDESGKGRVVRF